MYIIGVAVIMVVTISRSSRLCLSFVYDLEALSSFCLDFVEYFVHIPTQFLTPPLRRPSRSLCERSQAPRRWWWWRWSLRPGRPHPPSGFSAGSPSPQDGGGDPRGPSAAPPQPSGPCAGGDTTVGVTVQAF